MRRRARRHRGLRCHAARLRRPAPEPLDGATTATNPNCVVLATITRLPAGFAVLDVADPPTDPDDDLAADIARIDNRAAGALLPSTSVTHRARRSACSMAAVSGSPGTTGPTALRARRRDKDGKGGKDDKDGKDGKDGEGLEAGLTGSPATELGARCNRSRSTTCATSSTFPLRRTRASRRDHRVHRRSEPRPGSIRPRVPSRGARTSIPNAKMSEAVRYRVPLPGRRHGRARRGRHHRQPRHRRHVMPGAHDCKGNRLRVRPAVRRTPCASSTCATSGFACAATSCSTPRTTRAHRRRVRATRVRHRRSSGRQFASASRAGSSRAGSNRGRD